jgi:threonine dehydrogenase-like Zn-dependent dehydrogenase
MSHTIVAANSTDVLIKPAPVAMVWTGAGSSLAEIAVPGVALAEGDLLVAVELATVSGADVRAVAEATGAPLVLGHEQVGRIVAMGGAPGSDGVSISGGRAIAADGRELVVGMRVVWAETVACRTCSRCLADAPRDCTRPSRYGHDRVHRGWELSGGFASHVQVLAGTAVAIVDETTPATVLAPTAGAVARAAAALRTAATLRLLSVGRSGPSCGLDGRTVLVAGAGMMGLAAAALAAEAGAIVIVSEPDAARRQLALDFGATAVADPSLGRRAPGGLGWALNELAIAGREPVSVAIETSGALAAVDGARAVLVDGGVLVLAGAADAVGSPPSTESLAAGGDIAPAALVRHRHTVAVLHDYLPEDLLRAVEFARMAWHRHPFAALVGDTLPLARANDALDLAASGTHVRVGLAP